MDFREQDSLSLTLQGNTDHGSHSFSTCLREIGERGGSLTDLGEGGPSFLTSTSWAGGGGKDSSQLEWGLLPNVSVYHGIMPPSPPTPSWPGVDGGLNSVYFHVQWMNKHGLTQMNFVMLFVSWRKTLVFIPWPEMLEFGCPDFRCFSKAAKNDRSN